jgi:hypothetical protein
MGKKKRKERRWRHAGGVLKVTYLREMTPQRSISMKTCDYR